ncbi:hypothetical protein BGZ76_011067 [Entomortierella beljakovae]|nr:hypothetical protein BGZ76_011067 [Entomortierella beljakovae]
MKLKTIVVAITLVVFPLATADPTIPEISQLQGPSGSTPVPAVGNGAVTDPASTNYGTGTTSRLALYVPGTVYSNYPGWLPLYKALVIQGIPVKVTKDINVAKTHAAVIAYEGFQSQYLGSQEGSTWKTYVSGGKTLIAIGMTSSDSNLASTFGITPNTNTNANSRQAIRLNAPSGSYPASSVNSMFDLTDVRDAQIPIYREDLETGFTTIGYSLSTGTNGGAFALGTYLLNTGSVDTRHGITIKSASTGGGKAVAIGFDLGAYIGQSTGGKTSGIPRSYVAQYEPGYDNILRIIKRLYETATTTGLVTSWPVPGNKGVHFSWTYDIDAQDSYELAYVAARDLQSRGMKGTINWQAKLVKDAYDVASFTHYYRNISAVEALGNMELASHSVSHSPNLEQFPVGTGTEKWHGIEYEEDNYFPFIGQCTNDTGVWLTNIPGATNCQTPNERLYFYTFGGSLLGEARVSKYILEAISIVGASVKSFRTGHLLYPDTLPQVLAASGFKYSSSGASNDRNSHMPYQAFYNQAFNKVVDLMEFPLSASDEDGQINGDYEAPGAKYPSGSYAYQQYQLIQKIAKYGAQYTFLIHPTTHAVPGLVQTQFSDKLAFQQTLAPLVQDISYFDTMVGRGDFHNARINTGIDVAISGNVATVTVVIPTVVIDLTLRFPTAWKFVSSTVAVQVTSGAVVLVNQVAAGTYTLIFQTSGTVATTSAPAPGPATTTTSINWPSPTLPAPTPVPAIPRVVDDFVDPARYSSEQNALGFYTGDDQTVTARTTVQADWLLLSFSTSSYWYTLLGQPDTCNDYSQFTTLNLSVRYLTSTKIGFKVVLQDILNPSDCTGLEQHILDVTSMINSATAGSDGWLHLDIPLTSFTGVDLTKLRAVSLAQFASAGQLELNYIYFS